MSEDKIICGKCGKKVNRAQYCGECGASLDKDSKSKDIHNKYSIPGSVKPSKKKGGLKLGFRILIFFLIIGVVNLFITAIVMNGFDIPGSQFALIFFSIFFLTLIIGGIVWLGIEHPGFDFEGASACAYVLFAIVAIIIAIPVYIINAIGPIFKAQMDELGESISNFFSELSEGIEVPGFEPVLFVTLLIALSMFIVYRYHLKNGKNIILK